MHVSFETVPIIESGDPLVELSSFGLVAEPRYFATGLSSERRMFARKSVAEKLASAESSLQGFRIKVWDAWRPRDVQRAVYEKFHGELARAHPTWSTEDVKYEVELYVSNPFYPSRVPPHSTGGAVDLTLIDASLREVDMGTGFDHFGVEAHALYFEEHKGNEEVRAHRLLLRDAMVAQGFTPYKEEWWHFDYGDQKWALDSGADAAIFGEVMLPR